jgi:hypothetical protein
MKPRKIMKKKSVMILKRIIDTVLSRAINVNNRYREA